MGNTTPTNKIERPSIPWGKCRVWGTGHFYSSKAVVIPAGLAKRLRIQNGDSVNFKEDGEGRVIIEVVKKGEVEK